MKYVMSVMVVALSVPAGSVVAATGGFSFDARVTVAGVVANVLSVDGEGEDWTGAVLRLDLDSGSLYNDASFDSDATQANLWPFVPALRWDSAVGIANDGTAGIAGGAGDLGCVGQSLAGTGACAGSVTWFNTDTGDTGPIQIGNISLTDDANGSWSLILSFASSQFRLDGVFENGALSLVPYPEPSSLVLMGLSALAVLRRR